MAYQRTGAPVGRRPRRMEGIDMKTESKAGDVASALDLGDKGAPAAPMIDMSSPEFRKAVADAVAAEVAKALATQAAAGTALAAASVGGLTGDRSFIEGLTLSLAELANQGTGRIYVAPEVLKSREAARDHMIDLILTAKKRGTPPSYRLTNKIEWAGAVIEPMWLDNRVARPTEIDFLGIPNDAMVPINAIAKDIKQAWLDSIGGIKKMVQDDRLGMTAKGLVVRNGAIPTSAGQRAPALPVDETGEMSVHGRGNPGTPSRKPILGTIVDPPAMNVTPYPGSPEV